MKNKTILITGGTGSLGKALTSYILKNHVDVKKLIIFSRDEQKQFKMAQEFPHNKYPQIRYLIGDVRDYMRLKLTRFCHHWTFLYRWKLLSQDHFDIQLAKV